MVVPSRERWKKAFARIRAIERNSDVLPRSRRRQTWKLHGLTAVPVDTETASLPRFLRPKQAVTGEHRARVAADLIRIGKFDVDDEVRLRSFYLAAQRSVRFQAGGVRNGVERSLLANRHLSKHVPGLAPRILDHGAVSHAPYLVEELVQGQHPLGPAALEATIEAITDGLRALHRGVGVEQRSLMQELGRGFSSRWEQAVASGAIDVTIERPVRKLLKRDGTVPVSLGHGDLVGTNILVHDDGVTLIDWEYAGYIPILFDVAKLQLHSGDVDRAVELLQRGLCSSLRNGTKDYSIREQLALAHVRYLAWGATRWKRAKVANRLSQLEKVSQLRIRAIRDLLDLP